jgi:hypothetical protein
MSARVSNASTVENTNPDALLAAVIPSLPPINTATPVTSTAFATLTPVNAAAKHAYHHVANLCLEQSELTQRRRDCMETEKEKTLLPPLLLHTYQSETDSGTEHELEHPKPSPDLVSLWHGRYIFDINSRHPEKRVLWLVGKGRARGQGQLDFGLTPPTDRTNEVHGKHAYFAFSPNGHLRITPANERTLNIKIDGIPLLHSHVLNQRTATIEFGRLAYRFSYTEYADSSKYIDLRNAFIRQAHLQEDRDMLLITPTPVENTRRVGEWVIGQKLGRGTSGKVYSASNTAGRTVAIKEITRKSNTAHAINSEISVLKKVTAEIKRTAADEKDQEHRVVRAVDVIRTHPGHLPPGQWEDIFLVLTPAAPHTLSNVTKGLTSKNLRLFYESLLGLQWLHSRHWIHKDIKPHNIGVVKGGTSICILDLGCTTTLSPGMYIKATPGYTGTNGYMSPEREMTEFDYGDDVWALAVTFYTVFFGRHPWDLSQNPWRKDKDDLALRERFHELEAEAMRLLRRVSCPVGKLLMEMLRHGWSKGNRGMRVDATSALGHRAFRGLDGQVEEEQRGRGKVRRIELPVLDGG